MDELIGEPLGDVPKRDPTDERCNSRKKLKRDGEVARDADGQALFGGYCGAWPGKGTDHVGRGRCAFHSGATLSPSGPRNGAWRHGIYSDVVREEDREILDALEDVATAEKLEATLNLAIMKLRRAIETLDDPGREASFWQAFDELVSSMPDPDDQQIRACARLLDIPHSAQLDLMREIRQSAKALNDITDGQKVRHEAAEGLEHLADQILTAEGEP